MIDDREILRSEYSIRAIEDRAGEITFSVRFLRLHPDPRLGYSI
jgi:hypothetical protein